MAEVGVEQNSFWGSASNLLFGINIGGESAHIYQPHIRALPNNRVAGHILFSPIAIESPEESVTALALTPMAVLLECQSRGIDTRLIQHGLEACKKLSYKIVIVIGHPNHYPRFGFKPARDLGLQAPFEVPDDAFLVLELVPGTLKNVRGVVKYSPAFDSII